MPKSQPTLPQERILSIDILRGVAVLGILLVNIQSFSMIPEAYGNPTAYGDMNGLNLGVYIFTHLIGLDKFMTIFSILFGAGIILFSERIISKGSNPVLIHYRRILLLLIFGLIHAFLIWFGDILVTYSIVGAIVFLLRKMKPKRLITIGSLLILVPTVLTLMFASSFTEIPDEALADMLNNWKPDANRIAEINSAMQGSWLDQMSERVPDSLETIIFFIPFYYFWRVSGLMLIGMALFKLGVLSAKKSASFYKRMIFWGIGTGFPLVILGIILNFRADWAYEFSRPYGMHFNYYGSIGVAFGYMGLVMLISKSQRLTLFKRSFSAVGKMAFTNYILMSLVCTSIFYGHGFGLFGQVERKGQLLIVLVIWSLLLLFSSWWLKRFRFGPLEWFWRSLTYLNFSKNYKAKAG